MTDPQVRMLVTAVGYNEASRQLGIKAATLRKRAQREHWLRPRDLIQPTQTNPRSRSTSHSVTPPHNALDNTLREHQHKTKMHMAQYAERASREASKHKRPLSIARNAKDVESIRASLWPEKTDQSILNLNILNAVKVVRSNELAP